MNEGLSFLRKLVRTQNPDCDFDSAYMFFYDETNNHRKFVVRPTSFNVAHEGNFVLGGLVFTGSAPPVHELHQLLSLQASVKEIKLKNLASGDFLQCLQSPKLSTFLTFLLQQNVFVHVKSVNLLYYVLVDIVDSLVGALPEDERSRYLVYDRPMKSNLYDIAKNELPQVIALLHRYEAPNIAAADVRPFVQAWQTLVAPYAATTSVELGLAKLTQLLARGMSLAELPFVQDGESRVLLDTMLGFYMNNIYTFTNATHVFDRELSIEPMLTAALSEEPARFYFEDSKQAPLIQVSDVFAGLMGKFTQFVNTTQLAQLKSIVSNLTTTQRHTLDLLLDLLAKSQQHNRCFLHFADSDSELDKMRLLLAMAPLNRNSPSTR